MSHSRNPQAGAIRRAWDLFCATGDANHLRGLPGHIASSWQRSRERGVDPGLTKFPVPEPVPIWTEAEQVLLDVSRAALEPFHSDVHDASVLLTVSEKSGRIVLREGNAAALRAAERISSVPGALIREEIIGTNSVGTTLVLGDSVHVDFLEHFCEGFQDWADVGAAIRHPITGEIIGAVDLAAHAAALAEPMSLVARTAARHIEAQLHEAEIELHRQLLRRWDREAHRSEALVAVDRNGVVVALSDVARALLGKEAQEAVGRPLRSLSVLQPLADLRPAAEQHILLPRGDTSRIHGAVIAPVFNADQKVGNFLRLEPIKAKQIPVSRGWTPRFAFEQLLGRSPKFTDAIALARKVSRTNLPVLIQGETGTGKELFAHAIHMAGERAEKPFVTVNCGAIPPELIASELFGYEKGAFTGASSSGKRGKFEQADGGTIFLGPVDKGVPKSSVR